MYESVGNMEYDFNKVINRRNTNSLKWEVGKDELPMWVADMDFSCAPEIKEALKKRLDKGIFGYEIIPSEWYKAYQNWWKSRHDLEIESDSLIFSTGVVPAISSMVRWLSHSAEKVVLLTPIYNIFFNSIKNNGRVPVEVDLIQKNDTYEIDFYSLEKALSDSNTTLMILCNPQNPSGRIWTKDELKRIADLCNKYGVIVISDEIHCDIIEPPKSYVPFASVSDIALEISASCFSPSKAFNIAGLHSAAIYVPNELLRHRVERGLNTDECAEPNSFAIDAAIAAYEEGGPWLDSLNKYIKNNKEIVRDFFQTDLKDLEIIDGGATYLLWISCINLYGGGTNFHQFLRDSTGLFLSDGSIYGKNYDSFVRMNVACPKDLLLDGIERLKEGVRLYKQEAWLNSNFMGDD